MVNTSPIPALGTMASTSGRTASSSGVSSAAECRISGVPGARAKRLHEFGAREIG